MSAVEEVSHQNGAKQISDVVVRFAGDSGDGMQLTGSNFTEATAIYGNDLATFPDFPAEIRAPAGATFGVSAFQIYFGSEDVSTAGDDVDVLVAMNPAALITNIKDVLVGGLLIIDTDAFTDKNMARAGYSSNPIEDGSLDAYRVIPIAVTKQVLEAVKPFGLSHKFAVRCKNMWTLGLVTSDSISMIHEVTGVPCIAVFIPSTPTPFTGFAITVPRDEVHELPISIDEALRFTISGGVLVPPHQSIPDRDATAGRPEDADPRILQQPNTPPRDSTRDDSKES